MNMLNLALNLMGGGNQKNNLMGSVAKAAIPMILMGLFKNSQSKSGADSLLGALGQHESNNNAVDAHARVTGSDTQDGLKILSHIFGNDAEQITEQIAKQTGASKSDAQESLGSLAPVIMEMLADKTKSGRSAESIQSSILEELNGIEKAPEMPDISAMLGAQKSDNGIDDLLKGALGGGDAGSLINILGAATGGQNGQDGGLLGNILGKILS